MSRGYMLMLVLLLRAELVKLLEITFRSKLRYMRRVHRHGMRRGVGHDDRWRGKKRAADDAIVYVCA